MHDLRPDETRPARDQDHASILGGEWYTFSGEECGMGRWVIAAFAAAALVVVASATSQVVAGRTAYRAVDEIHFDGAQYRRDIAARARRMRKAPRI